MTSKNIKKYLYIVLSIIVIGILFFMQRAYIVDQRHADSISITQPNWNETNYILRYINSDWSFFATTKKDDHWLIIIDPASEPKWSSATYIEDENNFGVTFWFHVDCSEDKKYEGFDCQYGNRLAASKRQDSSRFKSVYFSRSGMEASIHIKDEYFKELQRRTLLK